MFLSQKKDTPHLLLAPMEGVGDLAFRKSMAKIGGFDEAVREFISVPCNAHVKSLAKVYQADELSPIPLIPQIMGSDPSLMAEMAQELASKSAPRIDINCGCPSNTVTGRGAGSSLLKNPEHLYEMAKTVVASVKIPVSLKMRSGYEDLSLFEENLKAAESSGVCFITLHPRTKIEGYKPPANWDLIARAKQILQIPVVGNGDIVSVEDALFVLAHTKCDALMIGRGAARDPFIFQKIRSHFMNIPFTPSLEALENHLRFFTENLSATLSEKGKVNKLKQLFVFLCLSNPKLQEKKMTVLGSQIKEPSTFLETILSSLNT